MVNDSKNILFQAYQQQAEKLQNLCSTELPNVVVHEARKSFKLLRALLFFCSGVQNDFFAINSKNIKELGKFVSLLRESFVSVQLFENEMLDGDVIVDRDKNTLHNKLIEKNQVLLKSNFEAAGFCSKLMEFADDFTRQIKDEDKLEIGIDELMFHLSKTYSKAYSRYKNSFPTEDAEELHELRKILKRLWYQVDFMKSFYPEYFTVQSEQLDEITSQLGNDHDFAVFLDEIKQEEYGLSIAAIGSIENRINNLRKTNIEQFESRLHTLFSDTPEVFKHDLDAINKV